MNTNSPTPSSAPSEPELSPDHQAAIAMSNAAADAAETRLRDETLMAGIVGSPTSGYSGYLDSFYDNLGLSWWKIVGLAIGAGIIVGFFNLPGIITDVAHLVLGGLVVWVFIDRFYLRRRS